MNSVLIIAAVIGITSTLAAPQLPLIPAFPTVLASTVPFLAPAVTTVPIPAVPLPAVPIPIVLVSALPVPTAIPVPTVLVAEVPVPAVRIEQPAPANKTKIVNIQAKDHAKSEARDDIGQNSLGYITTTGIQVAEHSYLKLGLHGDYVPVREGTYSYTTPEGIPVSYRYVVDENGFNIEGSPLPVAPQPVTPSPAA